MDLTQILNGILDAIDFVTYYDYSRIILLLKIIAGFSSAAFLFGIIYAVLKQKDTVKIIHAFDKPKHIPAQKPKNLEEWKKILEKANSEDENERKFAIIAADSLIEKILGLSGFPGENLGEKLKLIPKGDFDSIDDIWEAHKIRNRIAHEADFALLKSDAIFAVSRFEKALRELEYLD